MTDGLVLPITYDQLMLLLMGLFMFVGATRGWRQEFYTSVVLLALTAVLVRPELAEKVADYVNSLIRMILAFVRGFPSLDFATLEQLYGGIRLPFDSNNPYPLLIGVLVLFVLLSYNVRVKTEGLTAMSRVLGGVLGLFNAFLVISLFREYVLRHFQKAEPAFSAAGEAAPRVSVALESVPPGGLMAGERWDLAIALLGLIVAVVFISILTRKPIGKK